LVGVRGTVRLQPCGGKKRGTKEARPMKVLMEENRPAQWLVVVGEKIGGGKTKQGIAEEPNEGVKL